MENSWCPHFFFYNFDIGSRNANFVFFFKNLLQKGGSLFQSEALITPPPFPVDFAGKDEDWELQKSLGTKQHDEVGFKVRFSLNRVGR